MVEHNMSVVASHGRHHHRAGSAAPRWPKALMSEVSKNPAVIEAYMGSANVELKGAH